LIYGGLHLFSMRQPLSRITLLLSQTCFTEDRKAYMHIETQCILRVNTFYLTENLL
jgi:hypothetical protein